MRFRWLLSLILLGATLLTASPPAHAQGQYVSGSITVADAGTCSTASAFVLMNLSGGSASVAINVSNTFSATLSFVTTVDTAAHYTAVNAYPPNSTTAVTSTTGAGTWTVSVPGMASLCVYASAYASGTAVVAMRSTAAISASTRGGGGSGGSGTVSGQANGVIPLGTTATSITQQSHLDDGVTTASTIHSSENVSVAGSVTATAASVSGSGCVSTQGVVCADQQSGSDMCAKIANAWTALVAINAYGGTVDARGFIGTQACAGSMWTNYPYAPTGSQATTFCGKLLTSGVNIVTAVTQVMPACAWWDGSSTHAWPSPQNTAVGTTIQPANGFTVSTPIIEYGATNSAGTSPTDGIFVENLAVSCEQPNTTTVTGGIGIRNQYAQEGSGGNHIFMQGCNGEGLYLFTAGTLGGAQNSGSWSDIHVNMTGVTTTAAVCLRVGNTTHATGPIEGIHGFSCVGQSGTRPLIGVELDGLGTPFDDWHIENVVTGLSIGVSNNASVEIKSGYCVSSMTTCIAISNFQTINAVDISDVAADPGTVTNVLVDSNTNGGTAPTATENYIAHYARSANNAVLSTLTSIPTTFNSAVSATGGYVGPSFTANGTTAGFLDLPQGTTSAAVPPCNTATSICLQAPTAVTSYNITLPGAAPATNTLWCQASATALTFCSNPTLSGFTANGSAPATTLSGTTPYLNNSAALTQTTQCSFSLTTAQLTLALSPVNLCTITLPNAAVVWRVNCQGGWSVTAGTTPTFAVGNNWAQTPSGVFGAANIDTTNAGVGVQGTTSSTSNGNIVATGALTTAATIFTTNWWTTFTGSATSGAYHPTASLTGTSATGTLVGFCTIQ